MGKLIPYALKDTPNLIESGIFPVQKLSYEAQRERNSKSSQTLTGLGSYWKGRKPLILARAVVLGLLLPVTNSAAEDLRIFEKLLAFDSVGLARRAFSKGRITLRNIVESSISQEEYLDYIDNSAVNSKKPRWKKNILDEAKIDLIELYLNTLSSYPERADLCSRPEEVSQYWLYETIWSSVNDHLKEWGIRASTFHELTEQLGILRFGKRPKVGDPFAGGGTIPFEAARLGCDVYAADLNPVACLLNWGAFNIIGVSNARRDAINKELENICFQVTNEIENLGFETNEKNEKAKSFLYCHQTRCPQTQWIVPISGNWLISKKQKTIVNMIPDFNTKSFKLKIQTNATLDEMAKARKGTIDKGRLSYELEGKTYTTLIKQLRGDYTDSEGKSANKLRRWAITDIYPNAMDVFQERLYAIQWVNSGHHSHFNSTTYFNDIDILDQERENQVSSFVSTNIAEWQSLNLIPALEIERGKKTLEPIRTRGWTYWHHFFNPRQLLIQKLIFEYAKKSEFSAEMLVFATRTIDWNNRGCRWNAENSQPANLFYNQALNLVWNYCSRSTSYLFSQWSLGTISDGQNLNQNQEILCRPASATQAADIYVTDPPYADAVCYHEILEIFISWMKTELPNPFSNWTWDSRRTLAIKGEGIEFRKSMTEAYGSMANNMPENGYQCVMFTHSSVEVWVEITNILWASRLQVVSAWCVATETATSFRDGNHIQGTVLLILKKRGEEKSGFKQHILPKIRSEVEKQVYTMMNISGESENNEGEPLFSDADMRMAGQAAALRILTSYSSIDGEDVSTFVFQSTVRSTKNAVAEIISEAIDIANNILVPEKLNSSTWTSLSGIERFYLKLMDSNTTKLDTFQNFSKAFRVSDFSNLLSSTVANKAKLKLISKFYNRDLSETSVLGQTNLGRLFVSLQQLVTTTTEPKDVSIHLQNSISDFFLVRDDLINILEYIEVKSPETEIREASTLLIGQLRSLRFFNQ